MHCFILTGAGISAESGLKTFRDSGGLWETHDPVTLATAEAFARDPALVHRFYNWRRATAAKAIPNAAHRALADLETGLAALGGRVTLVTQNVDDLHQRAGSRVIAMHGTHAEARCGRCGDVFAWAGDMSVDTPCPICGQTGSLRPNIVWFGEIPLQLGAIATALESADVLVAVGTSGAVYPAAAYARTARRAKIPTWELNLEPADNACHFDGSIYGKATETVPRLVESILAGAFPPADRQG